MKKNIFFNVTSVALFLSPFFLTGCQALGNFFGEPSYSQDTYGRMEAPARHHDGRTYKSPAPSATGNTPVHRNPVRKPTTTVVPADAPVVHHRSTTKVPSAGPAAPSMAPSATGSSSASTRSNNTVVIPAAPIINQPSPATISAPTVNTGN
ncbi:hypothetical protein [Legionella fairfieldensis]|uniref:hypothetical protein n=1 Tax=Legionella fairfieldensis TaxID=45064 RepID=UPI00048E9069|nr:hypothetical protein [Legionella fairfieldensis]